MVERFVDGPVFARAFEVKDHGNAMVGAVARDIDEAKRGPGGVRRRGVGFGGEVQALALPGGCPLTNVLDQATGDAAASMIRANHDILDVDLAG